MLEHTGEWKIINPSVPTWGILDLIILEKNYNICFLIFRAEVFITKMNVEDPRNGCPNPGILVPRVWHNPRRFHFDNIGRSMLALFEVLSFKGMEQIYF